MVRRARLVSKTLFLIGFILVTEALVLLLILNIAPGQAEAATRYGPPSEHTLTCIRQWETGGGVYGRANYSDPGSNWDAARRSYDGYATAYQMDWGFAKRYSAPIPDEHWALWGSNRGDPPWLWHPMIQDETARNGYRDRRLGPWPPARRHRC